MFLIIMIQKYIYIFSPGIFGDFFFDVQISIHGYGANCIAFEIFYFLAVVNAWDSFTNAA